MELVRVKHRVVVKADTIRLEAIGLGKAAQLLETLKKGFPGLQEHCVYHRGGIADGPEDVAISL